MKDFSGKLAIITGGGTGMGRELAKQLIADGCDVAMCDIMTDNLAEALGVCQGMAPQGVSVTAHECDVADEAQVLRFSKEVREQHPGGGSFVNETREDWERIFDINWNGVYYMTRAFFDLLLASEEGHIINTSSINGFYAALGGGGPGVPHTAYSTAKFAVKGFTESLITDFRFNAPHLKASIVMPGYIGTDIALNTSKIAGGIDLMNLTDLQVRQTRERLQAEGSDVGDLSDEDIRSEIQQRIKNYRSNAPMSAAEAATVILDGVREERWRILVGKDAQNLDRTIRELPEDAYDDTLLGPLAKNYKETFGA
jgi:NAD(P)-dependent dehydrogenase (short-subunit alcohol dehydrogenase family)